MARVLAGRLQRSLEPRAHAVCQFRFRSVLSPRPAGVLVARQVPHRALAVAARLELFFLLRQRQAGLWGLANPLVLLDDAVSDLSTLVYMDGVRAGAACEHLRLALTPAVTVCRCNGHGRLRQPVTIVDGHGRYLVTTRPSDAICPDCGGKLLYNGQGLVCIRCPYGTAKPDSQKNLPAVPRSTGRSDGNPSSMRR